MAVLVRYFDRCLPDGSMDRSHVVRLLTLDLTEALSLTCRLFDQGVPECMIDAPDRCWRVQASDYD
jgi:hypothetical protein